MSKKEHLKLMLPFLKGLNYQNKAYLNSMVYGRFCDDFQKECLLFHVASRNFMIPEDVQELRDRGFDVCYVYDMLDLENREFTEAGFLSIDRDIKNIIRSGFTHILLANAYLIELVCNEYGNQIQVVLSQQLEFNSARAKIFFEVINDTACISHLVISQNHLTYSRLKELQSIFKGIQLVVEPDRWASDIQMIQEHYYNMVYGYYNEYVVDELRKFTSKKEILQHIKSPDELHIDHPNLMYKIGEINMPLVLYENNLKAVLERDFSKIRIIDLYLWENHNIYSS
jgi:hypothetical protein